MGWDICIITYLVARKEYDCDACSIINNFGLCDSDIEKDDLKLIAIAKIDGFKIKKGTQYVKLKGFYDGEPATFRAREDIHNICINNDFYDY